MPDEKAPDGTGCATVNGAGGSGPADVWAVRADIARPPAERMQSDSDAVQNSYCFLCGKTPVRLCYKPDGVELGSLLKRYFIGLKREGENP